MLGYLVHPTSTAHRGAEKRLRPAAPYDQVTDIHFAHCRQCGLPNDLSKIQVSDSDNSQGLSLQMIPVYPGASTEVMDAVNVAGCRFCGSLNAVGANPYLPRYRKVRYY